MRVSLTSSLTAALLAACFVTGCNSPKPAPPAAAPPIVIKKDTDWKYLAEANSETQATRDAQAAAERSVYDKAAKWADSLMPRVRERFALTDTADMLAYLDLAKDAAVTSMPVRIKILERKRGRVKVEARVKPDEVKNAFRDYLAGGAKYVTPAERPAYREWCLTQTSLR